MTEASSSPNFLANHLKLKGAENYASWKYHITDILGSKYLDEYILLNSAPPSSSTQQVTTRSCATNSLQALVQDENSTEGSSIIQTKAQIWKANDFKAKSIITANVQLEPSRIILKAKSASEAWETLRLKYKGKGLFLQI